LSEDWGKCTDEPPSCEAHRERDGPEQEVPLL
jgi:hypothetical protein